MKASCVLAITTSTARGGAAVVVDGRVAGARTYDDLRGHAERIFPAIDGALEDAGLDRAAITAVACDVGPGSFTGVRVGVASAKGIALGLGVPEIGVGSLAAMAEAAFHAGEITPNDVAFVVVPLSVVSGGRADTPEWFVAAYDAAGATILEPELVTNDLEPARARVGVPTREITATGVDAASVARAAAKDLGAPAAIEAVYLRPALAPRPT